jgi:hypothetical protein
MKNKIIKIKETIRRIWAIRITILVATLVTVIVWQNFSDRLPQIVWADEIVVKNEQAEDVVNCAADDIHCMTSAWVELRADELLASPEWRQKARLEAMLEANQMITEI